MILLFIIIILSLLDGKYLHISRTTSRTEVNDSVKWKLYIKRLKINSYFEV